MEVKPPRPILPTANSWATLRRAAVPLLALSQRELKIRYAGTWLGGFWAVLQPLVLIAIYLTVFVIVMQAGRDAVDARQYALFIVAGLLPFQALADGLQRACGSLRQDKALLEMADFPAMTIPLARVIGAAVPEILGLALLVVACSVWGEGVGFAIMALPILCLARLGLAAGMALWISVIAVFVTDMTEVLGFALVALLFLTPIFYAAQDAPALLAALLWLNPLHSVTEAYREVLLHNRWPWGQALTLLVWVVACATTGRWVFDKALGAVRDEL
jgi:lipopolysaccharide transport system permease protein